MIDCWKASLPRNYSVFSLSIDEARYLALYCQGFFQRFSSSQSVLQQLAYVQIDAISTIERAHHHVFWSRYPQYAVQDTNERLKARTAFEYWGHAASYLPLEDYAYYVPLMRSFLTQNRWGRSRYAEVGHLMPDILQRITEEGPLLARDFKGERKGNGWWQWKPAKVALELLYWQGELMVVSREAFAKVYEIKERFLPESYLHIEVPSPQAVAKFCIRRALAAHGIMTEKEMSRHLPLSSRTALHQALKHGLSTGDYLAVTIEGLEAEYYGLPEVLETLHAPENADPSVLLQPLRILSPFDNLVIQRERLRQLFGFEYLFEAYVPAVKRRYGYFTLPVLDIQRGVFVAMIALKAERKLGQLQLQGFWPTVHWRAKDRQLLQQHLIDFAHFQGVAWNSLLP